MKYVAYPLECDETVYHSGSGDTPEDAINDFTANALCNYCDDCDLRNGQPVEVGIFKAIKVSSLIEEEVNNQGIDPDWTWVSGDLVKTETVTAIAG